MVNDLSPHHTHGPRVGRHQLTGDRSPLLSPRQARRTMLASAQAQATAPTVNWSQVTAPGAVADVGVGPKGEVWIVTTDKKIYQMSGTTFTAVAGPTTSRVPYQGSPGDAVRVSVAPNGVPWMINAAGDAYTYDGKIWTQQSGVFSATDVGVGANGDVWWTTTKNQARKLNPPNGYVPYDGLNAQRVAVAPDGTSWVVGSDGGLNRLAGAAFQNISGQQAQDVGVGANGAVWITGTDSSISLFTGDRDALRLRGQSHGPAAHRRADTEHVGWRRKP